MKSVAAQILFAEAEENNLDEKVQQARWNRWHTCGLCEQEYLGDVRCALGWACWKTNLGRPETDWARVRAMNQLGLGLSEAENHADALSVQEAELSTVRRLHAPAYHMIAVSSNLANTYAALGHSEKALSMRQKVYSDTLRLHGEDNKDTFKAAINYANSLVALKRFGETKSLLRKTLPVTRRVLGENNELTLTMRMNYAGTLYEDPGATLDDIREAVMTLEETERTARRVLGGAHPVVVEMEESLRNARAALRARETPDA